MCCRLWRRSRARMSGGRSEPPSSPSASASRRLSPRPWWPAWRRELLRSLSTPELDGIRKRAGLLADRLHLAGILGVLEGDVRDAGVGEHMLQHRPVEQCGIAETRGGENDALGAGALDGADQMLALLARVGLEFRGGRFGMMQERRREVAQRIAFDRHVAGQAARTGPQGGPRPV